MFADLNPGDAVVVVNDNPLIPGNVKPPIKKGEKFIVKQILRVDGHDHIDIGLKSKYNYISCFHTGKHLPHGDKIHWCYPGRFEKA